MNYLLSTWEDRSKASAKVVFNVVLSLGKDLEKSKSILGAAGATGNQK